MPESTAVFDLPIKDITESPTNPRKTFGDLTELVASIKTKGVLQPVLARPRPSDPKRYELVFGARRLRASLEAGLKTIPAMVRELDDKATLEAQVIENGQRADVHPLEEADGYRALHENHGYSVDDIAAKVGKSKAFVYGRMKLCSLCEAGRKAFFEDRLTPSAALLVARIPDEKLQVEAVELVAGNEHRDGYSYRSAFSIIEDRFMLRFADAPFKTGDANLVPNAGPCSACPNRTGNQRELFGDVKSADVCTNPPCFERKKKAEAKRFKEQQEAKGREIVPAKKVFDYRGDVAHHGEWIDLKEKIEGDDKGRTWKQLLADKLHDGEVEIAVSRNDAGKVHEIISKDAAKAAAKEAGVKAKIPEFSQGLDRADWEKREEERRKEERTKQRVIGAVLEQLVEKAQTAARGADEFLHLVVELLLFDRSGCDRTAERRLGNDSPRDLAQTAKEMEDSALHALVLELVLEVTEALATYSQPSEALALACKEFGVDQKKLEASVRAAVKKEEKDAAVAEKNAKKAVDENTDDAPAPTKKGKKPKKDATAPTAEEPVEDLELDEDDASDEF